MDRAADSGPCDPSSIPLGEKKENKRKEAGVGPFKKKTYAASSSGYYTTSTEMTVHRMSFDDLSSNDKMGGVQFHRIG